MAKILVTIYFDIKEHLELEDRDYDRFIVEADENNFRTRLHEIFEMKKYSWDDFRKMEQGYKGIMSIVTSDLTELEVFGDKDFETVPEPDDEEEWAPEL